MKKYLDPKNGIPFKRVFGEHPELLQSFLNALMPFEPGQHIDNLEYLPAELVPDNPVKKDSIVDVRCKDNYGRQFIVEMQMYWNTSFYNRMVFNASKAYVKQLDAAENYNLLQPVYGLGVINDVFDNLTSEYYHHYTTVNGKNAKEVIKGLEYVLVELPKFKPVSITEKKMTVLWLRFLKEIKGDKYIEPAKELVENEYIRQALELCEEGAFSETELIAYERNWDVIRRENAIRETNIKEGLEKGLEQGLEKGLEQGLEKGRKEGMAEGIEKGRAEGLSEGIEKGREEGIAESIEKTVVKSFKKGSSIDFISSITDLSNDEIISILQKHNLMS
jgi:predicted transposase/invertase (TIGR01784 family)